MNSSSSWRPSKRRSRGLAAEFAVLAGAIVGIGGLTPGRAEEVSAQTQAVQKLAPPTFTLEVRRTAEETKGDIYVPAEWAAQLAIPARGTLRFRFGPAKQTGRDATVAATAEWRVYAGLPPVFDFQGTAPNLVKRGAAGPIPPPGKVQEFDVNLQTILPAKPDNKAYYVQIAGRDSQGKYTGGMSSTVALKYETSTWGTVLPEIPIISKISQDGLKLEIVLVSSLKPLKHLKEIPPDLRIVFQREEASSPKVWWAQPGPSLLRLKPNVVDLDACVKCCPCTGGTVTKLRATLPPDVSGGSYKVRLESNTVGYPTQWQSDSLDWNYDGLPSPRFTLEYQGLECLEDTDGPGSDEIRVRGAGGLAVMHDDVDTGEHHPAATTWAQFTPGWKTFRGYPYEGSKSWFPGPVNLYEVDGDDEERINNVPQTGPPLPPRLQFTPNDLKHAAENPGWHKVSVEISGDWEQKNPPPYPVPVVKGPGGRFRLWFALKAEPAPK